MLLLPLYLQIVRGETALRRGLLMIPQGVGAMIAMPIAGRLDRHDRRRADRPRRPGDRRRLVPGPDPADRDTSYWLLGGELFIMGLGMGFTMMPTFSGAMQTLRRFQISRASTTLNIQQQVGASIGTAILSVILANELASRLPGPGGGGIGQAVPPALRAKVAPLMAEAFGATFWYALASWSSRSSWRSSCSPSTSRRSSRRTPSRGSPRRPPVLVH